MESKEKETICPLFFSPLHHRPCGQPAESFLAAGRTMPQDNAGTQNSFLSSFSICPDTRRKSGKLPHKASILISSFQGCEAGQNTWKKSSAPLFMESTDFFTSQTESCLLYVIYEITEKLGIPHGNTSDLTFAPGTVQHPDMSAQLMLSVARMNLLLTFSSSEISRWGR